MIRLMTGLAVDRPIVHASTTRYRINVTAMPPATNLKKEPCNAKTPSVGILTAHRGKGKKAHPPQKHRASVL